MSLSEVDYAHACVLAVTASNELQCVADAIAIATPVAGHSRDVERAVIGKMNGTVLNSNINLPIFGSVCHPMNNTRTNQLLRQPHLPPAANTLILE
jgi:hypothetical protein